MNGFRTLAEGETVAFTVTRGPKGLQAENVTKQQKLNKQTSTLALDLMVFDSCARFAAESCTT